MHKAAPKTSKRIPISLHWKERAETLVETPGSLAWEAGGLSTLER